MAFDGTLFPYVISLNTQGKKPDQNRKKLLIVVFYVNVQGDVINDLFLDVFRNFQGGIINKLFH